MRAGITDMSVAILAGGLSTLLRAAIGKQTKILADVHGRPFIVYLLDQLLSAGFREVVLFTGYAGNQIHAALGNSYGPMRLIYSQETSPLGTAGALRLPQPLFRSNPVLVMNGDSYCDISFRGLLAAHRRRKADVTIAVTRTHDVARYGTVEMDENRRVTAFVEKGSVAGRGWINAGVYLLERELLQLIPAGRAVSLEQEMFPAWLGHGMYGFRSGGRFLDIGTPESYASAETFFSQPRRRLVVLDRDGTIIVEREYLSDPDDVELLPNTAAGLRQLQHMGLSLVVATNQSGIGRGFFGREDVLAVHKQMRYLLGTRSVKLDAIYLCPHRPDEGCSCRKPRVGMLKRAVRDMNAVMHECFVLGDKRSDMEFGHKVGATTLLVRTGYGRDLISSGYTGAHFVVDDILGAAKIIGGIIAGEGVAK